MADPVADYVPAKSADQYKKSNYVVEEEDLARFHSVKADVFAKANRGRSSFRGPMERSGHRMLCDRDYLYVVGGFSHSPSAQLFEEIWRFNLLSDKWEKVDISSEDFPHEMASFALCADAPSGSNFLRAYMFGGTTFPFGEEPSDKVNVLERLPKGSFLWRQLNTIGDAPIRQYGSSAIFHKGLMYLIGGTTGHVYNTEIRCLSRVENGENNRGSEVWEWKLLEDGSNLTGRYRHESVIIENEILIIGGGNTQWVADLDQLPSFDTSTNQLKTVVTFPDMEHGYPKGRMCHACVLFNGKVYVIGGCSAVDERTQSVTLYDDVWELDSRTWKWRKTPAVLERKICFHSAVVTEEGCVYVFGGALDGRFTLRCRVLQKMWLQPPSLQYFAQRAALASFPRLFHYSISDLTLSDPQKLLRIAYGVYTGNESNFSTFFDNVLYLKRRMLT